MKTKNFWLKALVLALCMTLSLSCLFACVGEEEMNEVNGKVDAANTELDKQEKTLEALAEELNAVAKNAATVAALNQKVAELAKADSDNKAELIDAIDTAIAEAKGEIQTELTNLKTALETDIDALETGLAELNTSVENQINELKATLATKAEFAELKAQIEAVEASWDAYDEATKELTEGEYTLDKFDALCAAVDPANYAERGYADFVKECEKLRFFLARAVSVDAIKAIFAQLETTIDELPTLTETLATLLAETTTVTADADCLDEIKAIEDKIVDGDATYTEELKTAFAALVAAHDNLLAAKEAAVALDADIAAIATPIVWEDSKPVLTEVTGKLDAFKALYFSNADYNKYYADGADEYKKVVTESATLTTHNERYKQLGDAYAATTIQAIFDGYVTNFETVRPLWSQLAEIDANGTRFNEWLTEYNIDVTVDAATLANIFTGGEVELYNKSKAYVDAMNAIYTNIGVDTLRSMINGLTTPALYSELATWNQIHENMVKLAEAIAAVENYDAELDSNYKEMVSAVCQTKLDTIDVRMARLIEAKAEFDKVYADMQAIIDGKVDYSDWSAIEDCKDSLDLNKAFYEIEDDNAESDVDNYSTICAAAFAKHDELIAMYKVATKDILDLYNAVTAYLNDIHWLLAAGGEIQKLADQLEGFVNAGVTDLEHIMLFENETDEEPKEYNFVELFVNYNARAAEYTEEAKKAQAEAILINALVEKLVTDKLDAEHIRDNARFAAAWAAVTKWCEDYLAEDIEAVEGNVVAAIAAIQAVPIFGEDADFEFITSKNYDNAKKWAEASDKSLEAAKAEWAAIKADMEALIAEWNVHSFSDTGVIPNFTGVMNAYNAYVGKYYAEGDTVNVLEENVTYALFEVEYNKCKELEANREDAAALIIDAIKALGEVTPDTAATVLESIKLINDLVEKYETTYCADGCLFDYEDNGEATSYLFKLYQTTKLAEFAAECKRVYGVIDPNDPDVVLKTEKVDNAWKTGRQYITNAKTEQVVDFAYELMSDNLLAIEEEVNPATPVVPSVPEVGEEVVA